MKINVRQANQQAEEGKAVEQQAASQKMQLDVKAESTYLNPSIDSKQKLMDWTLTMLGAPLVTVELDKTQFDAIIGDAVELYTKFASFEEKYLLLDLKDYEPGKGFDTSKYRITSVRDMATTRDTLYGVAMSDPFFGFNAWLNGGNGAGWGFAGGILGGAGIGNVNGFGWNWGGGFVSYQCAQEFLQTAHKLTGMNPDFQFDHLHQRLFIYPEPRKGKYRFRRWILITCEVEPTFEELCGNNFLKRIVLAKAKILLGTIRSKFQNVQLVGGGNVDTSIKEEGQAELDKVLEELRSSETYGNLWFFV